METIHERIKAKREAKGVTQTQMAKDLGVSYQAVQQWERSPDPSKAVSTAPKRQRLEQVAEYLGVSHEWLMTGKEPMEALDNPLIRQLIAVYDSLPDRFQEALIQHANMLLTLAGDNAPGVHNPFGKKK
jgi:transcriptional regulator with XRE-family HTH domain